MTNVDYYEYKHFGWENAAKRDKVRRADENDPGKYSWVDTEKPVKRKRISRTPTPMKSKFDGECVDCGGVIKQGQWMTYDGKAHHVACSECSHDHIDLDGLCMDCE